MTLNHSPETHKNLIARIPSVTGRELPEWFASLESGPAFRRCEERAHWLAGSSRGRQADGRFGGERAERADAIDVAAEDFFNDAGGAVDDGGRLMVVPGAGRRSEPAARAR